MSVFLASELSAAERGEDALFRVIPVPLERTVSYGAGTGRGPEAILEASNELERITAGGEPCARGILTEAAVDCSGPLPEVMERIAARTGAAAKAGRIPVTLGGEHSLSYGAVMGVARPWASRWGWCRWMPMPICASITRASGIPMPR